MVQSGQQGAIIGTAEPRSCALACPSRNGILGHRIMDIWKAIGFYAVLLYTGLVDIPTEMIESACDRPSAPALELVCRIRCARPARNTSI